MALMEASAKIGHFSMRTGGGYENIGKAWEGLHRYIAGALSCLREPEEDLSFSQTSVCVALFSYTGGRKCLVC